MTGRRAQFIAIWSAGLFAGLLLLCPHPHSFAGEHPPSKSPAALVRETIDNELKTESKHFLFRSRKQTGQGAQTHLYVQTKEAVAGMLVAVNDQLLDSSQRQAEEGRLDYLARNPDELRRKQKQEQEDDDRMTRIIRAIPDAFVCEFAGSQIGTAGLGAPGQPLIRMKFRPNPKYDPPTRVEQVLTGMEGWLLIDSNQHRIAKIDGTLYKDVSFGWGFFGHLDKGGRFQVEQGVVDHNSWVVTQMTLKFTGKILLFKKLVIDSHEVFGDFETVPSGLTFAQGVLLLKKHVGLQTHTPVAENESH